MDRDNDASVHMMKRYSVIFLIPSFGKVRNKNKSSEAHGGKHQKQGQASLSDLTSFECSDGNSKRSISVKTTSKTLKAFQSAGRWDVQYPQFCLFRLEIGTYELHFVCLNDDIIEFYMSSFLCLRRSFCVHYLLPLLSCPSLWQAIFSWECSLEEASSGTWTYLQAFG